ncbi:TonB-dependent receptor plug domain-containing protein [Oceanobacter mangrovi]|uniref:TonB-dependent receptor plug domain-containing protein n=1 Tax=Oceanobacter mangrovi TaxID=2862510 RepID=UPI001C8E14A9|nr:TonB-dependent receptor [Oceanobacter mangrovi]
MNKLVGALVVCLGLVNSVVADEFDPEFGTSNDLFPESELPVVLTATRLRQPRAEVPASVTVIEAEQIEAWGIRTLPDLMRFVPGMFVGHGDDENNAAVAYHSGSPNVMRRLQVLVDGRSVFRAGIASVSWNDIPVALEDIQRIEVTRGPSSATYGSNSFQGVINILTKHPSDTVGTQLRYRNGNQGVDDGYASHSWIGSDAAYRITGQIQASDNFDGSGDSGDNYRDSTRHGFVGLNRIQNLESGWQLQTQAMVKAGHTDIRQNDYYQEPPDISSRQIALLGKLTREFDSDHSSYIRTYWQKDKRRQRADVALYSLMLDPSLFELYRLDDQTANAFIGLLRSATSLADLQQKIAALGASDEANQLMAEILQHTGGDANNLGEVVRGEISNDISDERFDIEFQDTRRWNDIVRSVVGASMRRDQVDSETYFGGKVNNDTYRLFGNLELRPLPSWLVNLGATYEMEDANQNTFSPRIGVNYLITPEQSIRLIHSEATRSPDLLEQNPNYSITAYGLTNNYLGLSEGTFYMHQWPDSRSLTPERIISTELGYYGRFREPDLELDVKIFQEHMTNLINDHIAIEQLEINSDSQMDIEGIEMQAKWNISSQDWLLLNAASMSVNASSADESDNQYLVDTRLSARNSLVSSYSHRGDFWSVATSYFWYNRYNSQVGRRTGNCYRRSEVNLRVFDRAGKYQPWAGFFIQHLVDNKALVYSRQRYSTSNLYYLQAGINF